MSLELFFQKKTTATVIPELYQLSRRLLELSIQWHVYLWQNIRKKCQKRKTVRLFCADLKIRSHIPPQAFAPLLVWPSTTGTAQNWSGGSKFSPGVFSGTSQVNIYWLIYHDSHDYCYYRTISQVDLVCSLINDTQTSNRMKRK